MKKTLAIILSLMMILACLAFVASAAGTPTAVYIDDINSYSGTQVGPILLYGTGKTAANLGVSAHNWWNKVVLQFNSADGSFVVTQVMPHAGVGDTSYLGVTLADGEVMILTHDTFDTSYDNAIKNLTIGDKVYAYGFDFTNSADTDMTDSSKISSVAFTTYEPLLGDDYYGYGEGGGGSGDTGSSGNTGNTGTSVSCLVSLGAKVNTELAGIRFGAQYTKDDDKGEVIALGTLLIPKSKLGDNALDLDYAATDDLVVNVLAHTISEEDYVAGLSFEEYDSFVYYVTVVGLEGYEDMEIAARPYITYKSNVNVSTYYGNTLVRSINGVISGDYDTTSVGTLTYVNGYAWSDSAASQNHIFLYASADETATCSSITGQSVGFLSAWNGIVLEYNETNGTWVVVTADFTADNVNAAESATLGENRISIIFHDLAIVGQTDSYNFFKENAVVGAEFYLSSDISALRAVNGSITNTYLSLKPIEEEDTEEPEDPVVGTVSSTIADYDSTGNCTRSYGDTDGLSAVLYAPSTATGISTWLNLGAVHTTLYASEDALAKQNIGAGVASDTDVDNAYLYLCLNSTNWSGDFGLIKRLDDEDWEIVTSEYYYSEWRWNAYSYPDESGVTVSYNPDYVYWKWNVMDGRQALYIKDSEYVDDLQLSLVSSANTFTFSIVIGSETVFSVSDTATLSNIVLGRAASITNSSSTSYGTSNYLNQIASSLKGKTPSEMTNVQFYNTYYYSSSNYYRLTASSGSLWLYPNKSSSAGYLTNTDGDPIVNYEEVYLTDGTVMDIIDIKNY